ncbi:transmembrane protein 180 [Nematostella vectensis]|uniref:transmembrane protein 180 n=1 Tax=Nematostella vectensis TaxID=45351 RepID=UPI002077736A|nr:transmembrane protein 180 [Nematostella vectensis]
MASLHRSAIAYAFTTFAATFMNSIFNFYYVKIFLNVYRISEYWFNIAQVIFLIWNAINDPLFGYLQDTCESEIFRKRRKAVLYGAPLFAMSFLLPWFPWIQGVNGHWVTGVHLIVSLCFYDALFTYVLLAHCALSAEISPLQEDRHIVLQYSQISSLLSPLGLFFCVLIYNNEQDNFQAFQVVCVVVAVVSWLCMSYTGVNVRVLADKQPPPKKDSSKTCDVTAFVLFKQLVTQPNLIYFIIMNFFQVFHGTFQSNFFLIFADYLIGPDVMPSILLSILAGSSYVLPQIVVLMSGSLLSKYGSYHVIEWSFYIKFILAAVMYMAGRMHTWLLAFMFLADRTITSAASSTFNLPLSDVIDDDKITHNRGSPVSSMIFGTNALFTKPAQSLAPMLVVYVLARHGYKNKENTMASRATDSYRDLQEVMFQLLCLVPMLLAVVQIVFWRKYTLRKSRYSKAQFTEELAI